MHTTPEDVVEHWFGTLSEDGSAAPEVVQRWWRKDPQYDQWLATNFGPALIALGDGRLEGWLATPLGTLAYILLADQMSRNIHRDCGAMYDQDHRAMAATRTLLDGPGLQALAPQYRYFALMPLMHAEDMASQQECITRFEAEAECAQGALEQSFSGAAGYARKHAVIVEQFGRFPHRNGLLARESTAEEQAFLLTPGSSF